MIIRLHRDPDNTVFEAASMMATANIGAVVVVDKKGNLSGIVTERDLTRRVVGKGQDPQEIKIADIMPKNPDTLAPAGVANQGRRRHAP